MFQPFKGGGFDGHVIDLHTAVKDGVLGGGDVGEVKTAAVENEPDLKTMITNLELQETPSVFICPISLDPMQDPVTLCTGQTYERSNILKWLTREHRGLFGINARVVGSGIRGTVRVGDQVALV